MKSVYLRPLIAVIVPSPKVWSMFKMSTRCWTVEDEGITDRHVAFPPNETLEKSRSIHFDGMSEQNQTLSALKQVASIIK